MQLSSVGSTLFLAFEDVGKQLRQRLDGLAKIRFAVEEKHRALQEALCERENRLLNLLGTSSDAIVVIDDGRSILDANQRALTLLGISRKNIDKFTMNAFLPDTHISQFIRSGPPFLRGRERRGECQIKRLDGGRRETEFSFQANFIPGRHLCRFREIGVDEPKVETPIAEQIANIPKPKSNSGVNPQTASTELGHLSSLNQKLNLERRGKNTFSAVLCLRCK